MIKRLTICALAGLALMGLGPKDEIKKQAPVTVVEMFTSQGCAGCIPASAYLQALREQPNMVILSWPVDYLDRFGWEDTTARPEHQIRQKNYNERFGRGRMIYTPEMVIDGRLECIGHDQEEAAIGIANIQNLERQRINPVLSKEGDTLIITLPESKLSQDITINIAWYVADTYIDIGNGENKGTRMHAINVVRDNSTLGTWDGAAKTITVPLVDSADMGVDNVAILLQEGTSEGAILGAATVSL